MNAQDEARFIEKHEQDALDSRRRPEELGSIPGATFKRGPLLSWCCDAEPVGAIYNRTGIRTGECSKCLEPATFREIITP